MPLITEYSSLTNNNLAYTTGNKRVLRTLGETKLTLERGSKSTKSPREALLWISRHLELNSSVQKIAHFLPDFNADLCSKRAQFESAQSGRVHNDPLFGLITMVIWFQK